MPTHEELDRFRHEHGRLNDEQKVQFREALREFIGSLRAWERAGMRGRPTFPAALRVKPFHGQRSCWELTWAGDGRCLWNYGPRRREGQCHIVWLRIGSHEIFQAV